MMVVQLISACLGILGSVFFALGILRQSTEAMARLSGTYWNSNRYLPPALAAQKAEYQFGSILIGFAFSAQLASFLFSNAPLSGVSHALCIGVAVPATAVVFDVARRLCGWRAKRYEAEVVQWLLAKQGGHAGGK